MSQLGWRRGISDLKDERPGAGLTNPRQRSAGGACR